MKSRVFGFLFLTTILVIASVGFVSAQVSSVGDGVSKFLDVASAQLDPVAKWFLGKTTSGDLLLVKLLIFVIMLAASLVALEKMGMFETKKGLRWLIAIIIGILGARFLSTDALINFVWMPYGILGVLLATVIPFIIWFYFVESFSSPVLRKVLWVAFAVIYFSLAAVRWNDLAIKTAPIFGVINNFGWLYVIIGVLSIVFILLDRAIRGKYLLGIFSKVMDESKQKQANKLIAKITEMERLLPDAPDKDRLKIEIEGHRRALKDLLD